MTIQIKLGLFQKYINFIFVISASDYFDVTVKSGILNCIPTGSAFNLSDTQSNALVGCKDAAAIGRDEFILSKWRYEESPTRMKLHFI